MMGPSRHLCAMSIVAVTACGDPPICQSEVFVAIRSSPILTDLDAVASGIQAEVEVRTSLFEGEVVTLEVLDGAGAVATSVQAPVDGNGDATFASVTVTAPRTTVRASVRSTCGEGSDQVELTVLAGAGCDLQLQPAPELNPRYEPLRVLSTVTDPDPGTTGYQMVAVVTTQPGWSVELFETASAGEHPIGTVLADATGAARFAHTPPEGQVTFRATCRGDSGAAASFATTVFVDTVAPSCTFTHPVPGTTITPAFDRNADLADGVQLALAGAVTGSDVAGEPTTITITPVGGSSTAATSTTVDALGTTTGAATLAPATTPARFELALVAHDHAGNTCTSAHVYDVVYDGCDIAISAPGAPVTHDANSTPGDGSQLDVTVQVSDACVGRTVSSTCGRNSPSAVVPPGGQVVLRADVCSTSPCETQVPCTVQVTTADEVTTTAATTLSFDDQGPPVSIALVTPALLCGVQVTPATDTNPGIDGVQIVARVTSPGAAQRMLELSNAAGSSSYTATNDVTVTLAPGVNRLVGVGVDPLSNRSQTAPCNVTFADLSSR